MKKTSQTGCVKTGFAGRTGSRLVVGMAALSRRIFVGRLLKDGVTWREGKQDVTSDVLKAIVDFVTPGFEVDVTVDGKPKYRIRVTEIVDGAKVKDQPRGKKTLENL